VTGDRAVWMPDPRQLLLLGASLWRGEGAIEAWTRWRRDAPDLEAVERGSYRLLPLAYRNLGAQLHEDPEAERLKAIYRRSWSTNQLGLRIGRRAIAALDDAGLDVLALKGAALIGSAYGDLGARPMGDVDLAVRPGAIADAVRALRGAGLDPIEEDAERLLTVRHSLAFRDPDGQEIDLHRGMLWHPGLDEMFWSGSIEGEVAGARVRILNPADQLIHVCVHGAAWNPVSPIRWAADAHKVVTASDGELDWDRLVAMAEQGRMTLTLRDALACLAEDLGTTIPEQARRSLGRVRVSAGERRAHEALSRPPSVRRSLAMLSWFWERYRAQAALDGGTAGPAGLLRYLQGFWGLERLSQVPGYAMRRILRRKDLGPVP
jgi:Uncharacterised nucleotidyltransferase